MLSDTSVMMPIKHKKTLAEKERNPSGEGQNGGEMKNKIFAYSAILMLIAIGTISAVLPKVLNFN